MINEAVLVCMSIRLQMSLVLSCLHLSSMFCNELPVKIVITDIQTSDYSLKSNQEYSLLETTTI